MVALIGVVISQLLIAAECQDDDSATILAQNGDRRIDCAPATAFLSLRDGDPVHADGHGAVSFQPRWPASTWIHHVSALLSSLAVATCLSWQNSRLTCRRPVEQAFLFLWMFLSAPVTCDGSSLCRRSAPLHCRPSR